MPVERVVHFGVYSTEIKYLTFIAATAQTMTLEFLDEDGRTKTRLTLNVGTVQRGLPYIFDLDGYAFEDLGYKRIIVRAVSGTIYYNFGGDGTIVSVDGQDINATMTASPSQGSVLVAGQML